MSVLSISSASRARQLSAHSTPPGGSASWWNSQTPSAVTSRHRYSLKSAQAFKGLLWEREKTLLRHSLLACLFVSALTLSRPPDRVDALIPEPIARFSAPRTAAQTPPLDPEPRSAVAKVFPISPPDPDPESAVARVFPTSPPELEPRSAVARVFPISPPDNAIREFWSRPTLLAALPSGAADSDARRWAGRFDLRMEALPLSAATPAPISTERTRGEVMLALPLHQGVDVQVGVRVDVEDQVGAWKVNGTPTFGFEIRF